MGRPCQPTAGAASLLSVNGVVRQSTPLGEMAITPRHQIDSLRAWAPVTGEDALFTGTPEGVGRLFPGDRVLARLTDGEGDVLSEIDLACS